MSDHPDLMLVGGGRMRWWGSDCVLSGGCDGNATPDSMVCDACGSAEHTVELYLDRRPGDE